MTLESLKLVKEDVAALINNNTSGQINEADKNKWEKTLADFVKLYEQFLKTETVNWSNIASPDEQLIKNLNDLSTFNSDEQVKKALDKLIVVKLNGGLGTTMGCSGPKSLIVVRDNLTFLDLTINQLEHINQRYGTKVPLVLMNSFNTEEDTQKVLYKYQHYVTPFYTFTQNQFPRINQETLRPIAHNLTLQEKQAWYPPGHGDFYSAFSNCGLLKDFVEQQHKSYAFISNIDNLGATIDMKILQEMSTEQCDFVLEVTDKTKNDIKGGTIIDYKGKATLLELAQVPKNKVEEFKSVQKFKIFNTNNLWLNLVSLKQQIDEGSLKLDVIVNKKTLDDGTNIIQLETAIGSAIQNFKKAIGINVPRSRFLPVKNNSDLFLVKSNLYILENGGLRMNSKRQFLTTPYVNFTGDGFKKVGDFLDRFVDIPDILELDHLTVSGDVSFGGGVVLRGTVIIVAHHGDRIDVPSGATFENKIISGNLRILSH